LVMVLFKNFGVQKLGFQNNSSSLWTTTIYSTTRYFHSTQLKHTKWNG
jgi:hypothetical protein